MLLDVNLRGTRWDRSRRHRKRHNPTDERPAQQEVHDDNRADIRHLSDHADDRGYEVGAGQKQDPEDRSTSGRSATARRDHSEVVPRSPAKLNKTAPSRRKHPFPKDVGAVSFLSRTPPVHKAATPCPEPHLSDGRPSRFRPQLTATFKGRDSKPHSRQAQPGGTQRRPDTGRGRNIVLP